jgi:hypothetical protein
LELRQIQEVMVRPESSDRSTEREPAVPITTKDTSSSSDTKARVKKLMDDAVTAYKEERYVECQALATKASEIDPNELAAKILMYKVQMERRFQADGEKTRTGSDETADPSRIEALENKLKALQQEVDRLKKGSK